MTHCPRCKFEWTPTTRSTKANRYWFGVVVKAFQEIWSQQRRIPNGLPPYTKGQIHDTLVRVLEGEEIGPLGDMVAKPTKIMDSRAFWEMTHRARHLALHDYQRYIPEPDEHVADEAGLSA